GCRVAGGARSVTCGGRGVGGGGGARRLVLWAGVLPPREGGLGKHRPPSRCARDVPHATPVVSTRTSACVGPSAPHPCDAANQIGPHDPLPSRVGERCFGGPAGCPNAAQPGLQIVSTPLLGRAVADGKGAACPQPAPQPAGGGLGD